MVDMEWKGYESSIHDDDTDFCVTMVAWVDIPDSDQGDFSRRPAIHISVNLVGWVSWPLFISCS